MCSYSKAPLRGIKAVSGAVQTVLRELTVCVCVAGHAHACADTTRRDASNIEATVRIEAEAQGVTQVARYSVYLLY